jgi:hypothetical protein
MNGRHFCGGQEVEKLPSCNFTTTFSLEEYISCKKNLAMNRQTRMLADLPLVGCYEHIGENSTKERDLILLSSAKNNLHKMAYFGLTEYPRISQKLFEQTFDMLFLDADHSLYRRHKRSLIDGLSQETIDEIKQVNHLDMKLYEYAKELLFDRFDRIESKYPKKALSKEASIEKEDAINWGQKEDIESSRPSSRIRSNLT